MRQSVWVHADVAAVYPFARHKISFCVIDHFVRVYVRVIVWRGNREGMIVKHAWHERANNKVMSLKCLMRGRRLMDASGDGFEVFDVEDPWIEIAIPADDIKRMKVQHMFTQSIPDFNTYFKFAALGVSLQFFGNANIALGIGCVFKHLTELVSIAFGCFYL